MKVTVIGSHLCPDTLYALNKLCEAGAEVNFQDILSCHEYLLNYLDLREHSEVYAAIRGTRRIGVPCFRLEDGSLTLNLEDVLHA